MEHKLIEMSLFQGITFTLDYFHIEDGVDCPYDKLVVVNETDEVTVPLLRHLLKISCVCSSVPGTVLGSVPDKDALSTQFQIRMKIFIGIDTQIFSDLVLLRTKQ